MAKENILLVVIFQGAGSGPLDHIRYFADRVKGLFGTGFEELSYSTLVKGRLKTKTVKFTDANVEKFRGDLPDVVDKGFELLTLLPGWEFKSRDKRFSVSYNEEFNQRGDRILTISLNKESWLAMHSAGKVSELYVEIARHITEKGGELVYGFVFSMASEKLPGLFISGIGNDHLSSREEEWLEAWTDGKGQCDRKIWTVFWGNLVTSRHFKRPEDLDRLRMMVGEGNVHEVNGGAGANGANGATGPTGAVFFNLPGGSWVLGDEDKRMRKGVAGFFDVLVKL